MDQEEGNNKEAYIRLIESQSIICDRFIEIKRIDPTAGNGSFSLVFKAKDLHSKRKKDIILKFFNPESDLYRRHCFHREGDLLKELRGQRNILPLVQEITPLKIIVNDINKIPLVFHFYSTHLAKNSLHDYIYNPHKDYIKNIRYFREVCKAVQRIHQRRICHRDLKPDNFLIFQSDYVCLSDFGTARYFDEKSIPILQNYKGPVGDTRYTGPELLGGLYFSNVHNFFADFYSLGAILFELFTQTILSSNIFRMGEILNLIDIFFHIPETNRIQIYDKFIDSFAADRPLPSVALFDTTIPGPVVLEIDRLYQSLANLHYKKREIDFQTIFMRINICEKVLENVKKIDRWRKVKIDLRKAQNVKFSN